MRTWRVYVAGYRVTGDDSWQQRRGEPIMAAELGLHRRFMGEDLGTGEALILEYQPTAPGRLGIELVLYLILFPDRTLPPPITWREADTPSLPANILWQQRLVLRHEVAVE